MFREWTILSEHLKYQSRNLDFQLKPVKLNWTWLMVWPIFTNFSAKKFPNLSDQNLASKGLYYKTFYGSKTSILTPK